jgi:hypothetical protein
MSGRALLLSLLLVAVAPPLYADGWLPITKEDLALKDNPASPGSAAMILHREIFTDNVQYFETHYTRIKIFTEEGRKDGSGELVQLPLAAPELNRLTRTATLVLGPAGGISGQVQEIRSGANSVEARASLLAAPMAERGKQIETLLSLTLSQLTLQKYEIENLEDVTQPLILKFQFFAGNYAKPAGNLLLLRPRVMGMKGDDLMESEKPRKFPVEFGSTTLQTDVYEITLPAGYEVDELPPPALAEFDFAEYRSKTEVSGNLLRYTREFKIKNVLVPTERLQDLKKLYRVISGDQRNHVVLKKQ